jgi:4-diphosphocytidyl-2-C-methyl-D-erythritol kinase
MKSLDDCRLPAHLFAPAKLNLGLRITGRRADGYHELESLFWPVRLVDDVEISPADRFGLRVEWASDAPYGGEKIPEGPDNLVQRAVAAVLPRLPPWKIVLKKRIPMGGGLGGGSSDAGAVLRFLAHELGMEAEARAAAERLGADVPFFLDPAPTWVTGIGEKRERLSVPPELRGLSFILVLFPFPTLTPDVFRRYRDAGIPFSASRAAPEKLSEYLGSAGNDLEEVVAQGEPAIAKALAALRSTPCINAALSGSGSTCFATYPSETERTKSFKALTSFFRDNSCKGYQATTFDRI